MKVRKSDDHFFAANREDKPYLKQRRPAARTGMEKGFGFLNIVGKSRIMRNVFEQIINAAATDASVIICGEPGTGKELVAHAIHRKSKRHGKPFVTVHCGAIPESLFESEFFGYKKGAFSGAYDDKIGYLDSANRGTLFLDEIGEINPHMQMKLLRAIDGDGYTPVGSTRVKTSDFRIVAATNRDLKQLVQRERMRQDFFYRIHIIPIDLPPLRERLEDIPLLVDHFLKRYYEDGMTPLMKPDKFYEILKSYDWPGNVRELQNAIIRFCATRNLDFIIEDAPDGGSPGYVAFSKAPGIVDRPLKSYVQDLESLVISRALQQYQWHRSKVAALLKIDRKTLSAKIKRYHLEKNIH